MLVDALALLLGERASADVVRPGADKTVIEGAFEFPSPHLHRLSPSFTALGLELDDGRLVLKREIAGEGRSRAWVNGSPATVSMLAQLGALLVDLHGQHETQSLLRPDAQRDILDAYADAAVERVAVRDAHERLRELERRDAELKARREEVQRKADYLRHVIQEIERAQPRVGEEETLETEAKRLAHAEELGRHARARPARYRRPGPPPDRRAAGGGRRRVRARLCRAQRETGAGRRAARRGRNRDPACAGHARRALRREPLPSPFSPGGWGGVGRV